MKIGIDISQLAYANTGVSNYLEKFVKHLVEEDKKNEYILFFSSMRRKYPTSNLKFQISSKRVTVKTFPFPPSLLDLLWNRWHILPIEWLIGPVDIFITSDWTEPPVSAGKKATIIYDLIVYLYPQELASKIVSVQKRKLHWVKKESNIVFCISKSTKKDVIEILKIPERKLKVVYPGI